ncbi:NADP-specific glutamate dehydrogenase [Aurantiacibacter spongiae]|uniref:Glutamate dehydrogenase n=1 Tax=Aurantiacibacter spongiae TaxID=2488860 RepID=A0A3N5CRM9_9SPHN|nr:NADP-specific glutamate dehydrogenase [Aurantiacibacter spongiae]RPF71793.1 NADP-specific glutamate dehydrogenase [Aurantiacibacter spongiae]
MASKADQQVDLDTFISGVEKRNPGQGEFVQAVREVSADIFPWLAERGEYHDAQIMRRLAEPDRIVSFRVCWQDDEGRVRVERGWRVQNNNAIGPYKGGLRFDESVTESVLKFLAFEQTFKNSLTGLPLGGGKGGSNFNPKDKSDEEIMRFCQSFMTELYRHIGPNMDVPAGDMGVGSREIGYLFGQYKRITGRWEGVMTGKAIEYGGSKMRPEATGYGAVEFACNMLHHRDDTLEGKTVLISGSGNVALHAAAKVIAKGGTVLTLSDSDGFIHDPDGIDADKLDWIRDLKLERRGRIGEYADEYRGASFQECDTPWRVDADIAMPCATQNEIDGDAARALLGNGILAVVEGANMPATAQASRAFREAGILYAPGKAANAGGVAVSGLEMSQNAERISWENDKLDRMLADLMRDIHERCVEHGADGEGGVDYVKGANIAGFRKVADAMLAFGVV